MDNPVFHQHAEMYAAVGCMTKLDRGRIEQKRNVKPMNLMLVERMRNEERMKYWIKREREREAK